MLVENLTATDFQMLIDNEIVDPLANVTKNRTGYLNLSEYSIPGYTISKIDVNITDNSLTAQNDWIQYGESPGPTYEDERIFPSGTTPSSGDTEACGVNFTLPGVSKINVKSLELTSLARSRFLEPWA